MMRRFVAVLCTVVGATLWGCESGPATPLDGPAALTAPPVSDIRTTTQAITTPAIVASKDVTNNPGRSQWGGASTQMWVGHVGSCNNLSTSTQRTANVAFDLSAIPQCATVTAVSVQFTAFGCTKCQLQNTLGLHRLLGNWTEGADTTGSSGTTTAGVGNSGPSANSTASATQNITGPAAGADATVTFAGSGLVADVQTWVNNNHSNNYGWQIRSNATLQAENCGAATPVIGGNKKHLYTKETAGKEPKITVTYSLTNSKCNDSNDCTNDVCNNTPGSGCTNNAVPGGSACEDGQYCTVNDSCSGTTCVSGGPRNCSGVADQCNNGVCNETSNQCVKSPKANGTTCNDNLYCTVNDQCTGGNCSGAARDCSGVADQCNNASCNEGTDQCVPVPKAGSCNDGNACTSGDTCSGGICSGSPIACNDNNVCTTDTCDTATGCVFTNRPNQTPCTNDGNICTRDVCIGGQCNTPEPAGTVICRAGTCSGTLPNAQAIDQEFCNGTATCPGPNLVQCGNQPCNAGGTACQGQCGADGDCPGGFFCASGTCTPVLNQGQACNRNAQCANGICRDGRCCNNGCGGGDPDDCRACNVPGSLGTCTNLDGTACEDGDACTSGDTCATGTCTAGGPTVCDDNSDCTVDTCDSSTGCVFTPGNANTICRTAAGPCDIAERCDGSNPSCPSDGFRPGTRVCRAAQCVGGSQQNAATCTGSSADCPASTVQNCSPYACSGTECLTSCTDESECAPNHFCESAGCFPKRTNGGVCTADYQCRSDHCVDGVCCNEACAGQCEACNIAGSLGQCSAATGDPVGTRPTCSGDGSVCNGFCNGANRNSCTFPGGGTRCRNASCRLSTATLAAFCDGSGSCPAVQTQDCAPNVCGATQCANGCNVDAQCVGGTFCSGGVCVNRFDDGEVCAADVQCSSGRCVDGVCCNEDCNGQCEACNLTGSLGTCAAVSGSPVGGRPQCETDGTECGGHCNGTLREECSYPASGVRCRAPSCDPASGTAVAAAFCNGAGSCPDRQEESCGDEGCDGSLCANGCVVNSDCVTGEYCSAGVCKPLKPNATACSTSEECVSGVCADNVCCATPCTGQCEACDVSGFEGVCWVVTGEPRHGRPPCAGTGTECAGTCNGGIRDGCVYPANEIVCRDAECTGRVATLEGTCQGNGSCAPLQEQSCAPFACSGDLCNGDCATTDDCPPNQYCSGGICAPKLTDGEHCGSPSQCASNFCIDGVCCETTCSGRCEACDLPGQAGQCLPVTGKPRGGRPSCAGVGPCAGFCDGNSRTACTFPALGAACGDGICVDGVASAAARCNGVGTCVNSAADTCTPFICDEAGESCLPDCVADEECVEGFACVDFDCVPIVEPPDAGPDARTPDAGEDAGAGGAPVTDAAMDTGAAGKSDAGTGAGGAPSDGGTGGQSTDAGAPADASGARDAGDAGDAGAPPEQAVDEGGCGCRQPGHPPAGRGSLLLGLGVFLLLGRRRRVSSRQDTRVPRSSGPTRHA